MVNRKRSALLFCNIYALNRGNRQKFEHFGEKNRDVRHDPPDIGWRSKPDQKYGGGAIAISDRVF